MLSFFTKKSENGNTQEDTRKHLAWLIGTIKVAKGLNTGYPRQDFVSSEYLQKEKFSTSSNLDESTGPLCKSIFEFDKLSDEPLAYSACVLSNGKFANFFVKDIANKSQLGVATAEHFNGKLKEDGRWYIDIPHADHCSGIFFDSELKFLIATRQEVVKKATIFDKQWITRTYISIVRLNPNFSCETYGDVFVFDFEGVIGQVHGRLSSTNLFAITTENKDGCQLRVFKIEDAGAGGFSCHFINMVVVGNSYVACSSVDDVSFNQLGDKIVISSSKTFKVWPVQSGSNSQMKGVTGERPVLVYNGALDSEFLIFYTCSYTDLPIINVWKVVVNNVDAGKAVSFEVFTSLPYPGLKPFMGSGIKNPIFHVHSFYHTYILHNEKFERDEKDFKVLNICNPFTEEVTHKLLLKVRTILYGDLPLVTVYGINWSGNEIVTKHKKESGQIVFNVFSWKSDVVDLSLFKLAAIELTKTNSLYALRKMDMPKIVLRKLVHCVS